jgi:DNA polymerase I-like protein with 3'-5' exonuclease and polymerase domains
LNGQTIPGDLKTQFVPPPGEDLLEIDLRQAESRFVAWDGPVPRLQQMFKDGTDIHRFVASHPLMFNKPQDKITKDERQLGKKTGHAANYGMGGATLSDQCLKEMDLVLPINRAERMLEGYHAALEGGVRRWQKKIEDEVTRTKRLKAPLGHERYFYDRLGPDLFKEAYAYKPQNTVVTILNELLLFLFGRPHVTLLDQIHDSLLISIKESHTLEIINLIKDEDRWNPRINLIGGELRIPIEIKRAGQGQSWGSMEVIYEGS